MVRGFPKEGPIACSGPEEGTIACRGPAAGAGPDSGRGNPDGLEPIPVKAYM